MPDFLAGVAAQRDGRWSDGSDALDRAVQELDRQGVEGTFEHMMALVHRTQLDLFAQNLTALERSLARLRAATHGTGDSATRCHLVFIEALRLICRGQFQDAADLAQELAESWQMDQPSYQRFIVSAFVALTRIYLGDPARARRELAGALRRERAFRPLQSMYGGLYGAVCALAEASALRLGDRQASARRCRRYAALAREATPMWTAGAWRARAYAADAGDRPERALALLEQAEAEAAQFGQQLDVAVARYQRGLRLGGDAGAGLQQEARQLVQQIGAGVELLDEDPGHR
jgi:hypothetical protein